ncbi:helix-turn-helix domain-containing protein [Paenibacillus glacialis]|uniref:HTH araC/xylS-type domain-containing protein n=1 Tax=Paenibacillus glacialis TaxID=494026 RepID=A0A162K2L4_9BACL|nr:helix-turn-helix domain-containing protein [Paenibacillus glacialis]OAB42106.1 hypothetical protein PGLA_13625 [Paenibacillus glacialis]
MNNEYKERMDNVIKYIEDNSNQKLTLDILAGVSNFSKYHFTRIFTSIIGVTPVAFVNQERLQKAVYLLGETNKPIVEISNQCGFESVSTFNALFKRHYGTTPSDVRYSGRKNSNFSLEYSNKQEELAPLEDYNRNRNNQLLIRAWDNMITIKELPDYEVAYQSVFSLWLPSSEYDADDRPCLEFCMNDPAKDKEGKCKVDLYIPIKKRYR